MRRLAGEALQPLTIHDWFEQAQREESKSPFLKLDQLKLDVFLVFLGGCFLMDFHVFVPVLFSHLFKF